MIAPARLTRIKQLIDAAESAREMAGIRWSLEWQGEWTDGVSWYFQRIAEKRGWWPVTKYEGHEKP